MPFLTNADIILDRRPNPFVSYYPVNCRSCKQPTDYYIAVYMCFFSSNLFGSSKKPECRACTPPNTPQKSLRYTNPLTTTTMSSQMSVDLPIDLDQDAIERAPLINPSPAWSGSFMHR